MTSEGFGEVFKGDSEDMCARKFPLVSMGGRAGIRKKVQAEKGLNRRKVEPFSARTFFLTTFFSGSY
jgi:hypothetical protein